MPVFVFVFGQSPIDFPVIESINLIAFDFHFDKLRHRVPDMFEDSWLMFVRMLEF